MSSGSESGFPLIRRGAEELAAKLVDYRGQRIADAMAVRRELDDIVREFRGWATVKPTPEARGKLYDRLLAATKKANSLLA